MSEHEMARLVSGEMGEDEASLDSALRPTTLADYIGQASVKANLRVAIEEWLARIPEFELADPDGVRWATGQVRGPRELPVRILTQES